jgi:5'-phosphate synthase pdxT subunit
VLALQGAFAAHSRVLTELGVEVVEVRRPDHLAGLDALVMPGGESTTMSHMLGKSELFDPIAAELADGLAVLGTCAGLILMATEVVDGRSDQKSFGAIELRVRRNGYGRQRESFETELDLGDPEGGPFPAVFIRAPVVEAVGESVTVLATFDGRPVLCQSNAIMVASFHPELSNDNRVHEMFLDSIA